MERPANEGGPHHEPGQRFDKTHRSEPVVCPLDPLRDCHQEPATRRLGTVTYCRSCADDYVMNLRRRVARREAGLPEDSSVGIGVPLYPAIEWGPGYHLLQCDSCPYTWIGMAYAVCQSCAAWWRDAAKWQDKARGQR